MDVVALTGPAHHEQASVGGLDRMAWPQVSSAWLHHELSRRPQRYRGDERVEAQLGLVVGMQADAVGAIAIAVEQEPGVAGGTALLVQEHRDVEIGVDGASGHVIEYTGPAIRRLDMEGRMTVCNMSIEAGARAGLIGVDEVTLAYVQGRPYSPRGVELEQALAYWRTLRSDPDAHWDAVVELDASTIRPQVTWGNALSKLVVGPVFGFLAGVLIDRLGPRRVMIAGILMAGAALVGLSGVATLLDQTYDRVLVLTDPTVVDPIESFDLGPAVAAKALDDFRRGDQSADAQTRKSVELRQRAENVGGRRGICCCGWPRRNVVLAFR